MKFIRESLRDKKEYVVADHAGKGYKRMHQNEGLPWPEAFLTALDEQWETVKSQRPIHNYPPLSLEPLRMATANLHHISENQIEIFSGSSEALTVLVTACAETGRSICFPSPSFSLYKELVSQAGAEPVPLRLNSKSEYSDKELFSDKTKEASAIFLCSPNNPTGTLLEIERIEKLLNHTDALVVVDEAYFEFAEANGAVSSLSLLKKYENIVVLRTLSKAWSAPSLRIGFAFGNPDVISVLRALRPPYSVTTYSFYSALFILQHGFQDMKARVKVVLSERKRLEDELKKLGIDTYPSEANFIFFHFDQAVELEEYLRTQKKILIRIWPETPKRKASVRLSICDSLTNTDFLQAFQEFLNDNQ